MDMVEKGSALSCHSEKALAFGILATPPGRTLELQRTFAFVLIAILLQECDPVFIIGW